MSLSGSDEDMVDTDWLNDLPAEDAATLYNQGFGNITAACPRTLVGEVFEQQERFDEAIKWGRATIVDDGNFSAPDKIRAGRLIARCHARLGQHALSVAASDAALAAAQEGRYLLSESLCVRGRALAGREAGGAGGHWSEGTGRQRLAEVAGRMQAGGELLELGAAAVQT